MPRLEDWEIKKYWEIFQGLKPSDNKLTGDRVSPILKNSRLPDDTLSKIWELSDIDNDGKLDFEEFCITMRLIYDMVNDNKSGVPSELPSWLVPASKAHLIHANKAVNNGNNNFHNVGSSGDDEDEQLSDNFDWYISPTDKASYEAIYDNNCDDYGRVKFESLEDLYKTLNNVPRLDVSSAWNLVNPKQFETIDKDQVLIFLHILNQRSNGKRVPRGVPASLRATFSKEQPNYDLNAQKVTPQTNVSVGTKGFANDYLNKIGSTNIKDNGTDFSATEGTDWEVVRLRRELANLEDLLSKTTKETESSGESSIVKHELELLLNFKESKINSGGEKDLTDVKNDIEVIETQVSTLEEFLKLKQNELSVLQEEISQLS